MPVELSETCSICGGFVKECDRHGDGLCIDCADTCSDCGRMQDECQCCYKVANI